MHWINSEGHCDSASKNSSGRFSGVSLPTHNMRRGSFGDIELIVWAGDKEVPAGRNGFGML